VRRKGIGAVALGAVVLIAAVAGFIIVPEHEPGIASSYTCLNSLAFSLPPGCHTGLSRAAYDGLRIGTWAVLIVGVLLVAMGLIRYARPGGAR
jgi:hypothetical protein